MDSEPVVDIRSIACATSIREILSVNFRLAVVIVSDLYNTEIPSVGTDSVYNPRFPAFLPHPLQQQHLVSIPNYRLVHIDQTKCIRRRRSYEDTPSGHNQIQDS